MLNIETQMLNVDHINFSYGRTKVLKDVSFMVEPGEIVAMVGANGAGKTTLIRILAFVLMQDEGNVNLNGVDPLTRPIKYRKSIGYLSERCPLYEEMQVEQYLLYRLKLRGERASRLRRRIVNALDLCGLRSVANREIRALSKGYKKRIGLADAIIQHPRLLLMDDPLAGLDVDTRQRIGNALTDYSTHAAVVLTGHEVDEFINWCTRFIVLTKGGVSATYLSAEYDKQELKNILKQSVSPADDGGVK
jgi:ABC-2 type transport system ATP-binding protein